MRPQPVSRDLAVDPGHLQRPDPLAADGCGDDVEVEIDCLVETRSAGRAHDHAGTARAGALEHRREVLLLPLAQVVPVAGAKVKGADIARPGVGGDHVGPRLDPGPEGLRMKWGQAQRARGAEDGRTASGAPAGHLGAASLTGTCHRLRPSRSEISCVALVSSGTQPLGFSSVQRSAGPASVSAALTMPPGSRIGAEIAEMPRTRSLTASA